MRGTHRHVSVAVRILRAFTVQLPAAIIDAAIVSVLFVAFVAVLGLSAAVGVREMRDAWRQVGKMSRCLGRAAFCAVASFVAPNGEREDQR